MQLGSSFLWQNISICHIRKKEMHFIYVIYDSENQTSLLLLFIDIPPTSPVPPVSPKALSLFSLEIMYIHGNSCPSLT